MKKVVIKIISCICIALIILLRIYIHILTSGDMTSKNDIIEIVLRNRKIINDAVYTIYSNNIIGIYDTEERELPESITGIEGKYIIRDTGERDIYSSPIYSYELLTDKYLTALINIKEVKSVKIDKTIIDIYFGGRGIVPSGVCSGVYYFPNDDIADAASKYKDKFEQSENGWICKPKTGDDSFYIERICENLWYYEEKW